MNRKKLLKKVIIKYGKLDFKPIYKERQTLGILGIMYQYPDDYEYFYDEQGNILKGFFLGWVISLFDKSIFMDMNGLKKNYFY